MARVSVPVNGQWVPDVDVPLSADQLKQLRAKYRERCLLYAYGERGPRHIARAVVREEAPQLYEGDTLLVAPRIELVVMTDVVRVDGELWENRTLWAGSGASTGE